jgi:hypothetical protein
VSAETDLLEPCPFCGEPAEIDTMQAFRALVGGDVQKCVAIYCTVCTVQVQHCYKDHPGEDRDALRDDLIAAWNRRACVSSATEALRAERDLFRAETIALAKDAERLAEALRDVRVIANQARVAYSGDHSSGTFRAIVAKIDAALEQETTNG